jgi:NAD(P)-dependent dehydrogenase (short-subunit alcohol dehydrogenase family)
MENLPTDFFVTSSAYTPTVYRDEYPSINPLNPALSQAGKVIIITGASDGIGARGFAPAFLKAGPKAVILVGRSSAKLAQTEKNLRELRSDVELLSIPTDISNPHSVDLLFEAVRSRFGHADVLVNNAALNQAPGNLDEVDPQKWWTDFDVNVKGTFLVTQGFLSLLGKERQGTIVNLSTGIATAVMPGWSSYSITKLAAIRLAEYVAAEYPNVNAVALQPGVVDTAMIVGKHGAPYSPGFFHMVTNDYSSIQIPSNASLWTHPSSLAARPSGSPPRPRGF